MTWYLLFIISSFNTINTKISLETANFDCSLMVTSNKAQVFYRIKSNNLIYRFKYRNTTNQRQCLIKKKKPL